MNRKITEDVKWFLEPFLRHVRLWILPTGVCLAVGANFYIPEIAGETD